LGARLLLRAALKWPNPIALAATSALILLVPTVAFAANFSFSNRRNFFLARDYVNNIQSTIGHGGMLLTSDWQVYSPTLYFREVEQQRRDVITIDISLLRRSWYFDYLKQQYPDLINENREKVEVFLADLRRWENDPEAFNKSAVLTHQINNHFFEMILDFVSTQMKRAPVYVTWEIGLGLTEDAELTQSLARDYQLIPQGLIFQLSTDRNFQMPADAKLETRGLSDNTFRFEPDDVVMVKVFPVYVNMLVNRGKYLAAYGHYEDAIKSYQRALEVASNDKMALDAWSDALEQMRKTGDESKR
jgi:tetratricopeptide (TPR) repeat protein